MEILDHLNSCRNLVNVAGHAHHVDDALAFWQKVRFKIAAAYICHHGNLHIAYIFANNGTNVLFLAELPLAKIRLVEKGAAGLIPKLHIVHAAFDIGLIQFPHKFVAEVKVVAQSAVANGGIQHLNVGAHAH